MIPSLSRADWLWVGLLALLAPVEWLVVVGEDRFDRPALSLAVMLLAAGSFLLRPRYPVAMPFGVVAALVATDPAAEVFRETAWAVAVWIAAIVLLSIELRGWRCLAAAAAIFVGDDVTLLWRSFPEEYWIDTAWSLAAVVPAVIAGRIVGSQRDLTAALRDRNDELERERERLVAAARAEERARIARELHDVVAHSVSMMVVQTAAARRTLERDPRRAAESFGIVGGTGRDALAEMHRLLAVLDPADGPDPDQVDPGVGRVGELVARSRAAGLRVSLCEEGAPQTLEAEAALAAYRVVQEALTNAVKHAGGAPTVVALRWEPGGLEIVVTDRGGSGHGFPGAGRGIAGMRERVEAIGGDLDAGPVDEGGFAVRARLPLAGVVA